MDMRAKEMPREKDSTMREMEDTRSHLAVTATHAVK